MNKLNEFLAKKWALFYTIKGKPFMLATSGKILALYGLGIALGTLEMIFGNVSDGIMANLLFTLTTGAAVQTNKDLPYCPQFIAYTAATQITSLRVTTLDGGIICDLDATGLTALRGILRKGVVTNGNVIQLANGLVPGRNILIEAVNSGVQTPSVFGWSEEQYPETAYYVQSIRAKAFANTSVDITNFAYFAAPSMASTDQVNITFRDGLTQTLKRDELQYALMDNQNEVNTPNYAWDNTNQRVRTLQFIGSSDQTIYVVKFVSVDNKLTPTLA